VYLSIEKEEEKERKQKKTQRKTNELDADKNF